MTDTTNSVTDALPERDTTKTAEQQGLFRKFDVRRVDGSDQLGGKHHGCRYYVLDVDHDPYAAAALGAYADACKESHPELARDLREKWGAANTIDTLRAENERLRATVESANGLEARGWAPAWRIEQLEAQLAEAQMDSERLATYFAPRRFTPEAVTALLPLELRAFNDDHPTLDEWRAAIDAAKGESS